MSDSDGAISYERSRDPALEAELPLTQLTSHDVCQSSSSPKAQIARSVRALRGTDCLPELSIAAASILHPTERRAFRRDVRSTRFRRLPQHEGAYWLHA